MSTSLALAPGLGPLALVAVGAAFILYRLSQAVSRPRPQGGYHAGLPHAGPTPGGAATTTPLACSDYERMLLTVPPAQAPFVPTGQVRCLPGDCPLGQRARMDPQALSRDSTTDTVRLPLDEVTRRLPALLYSFLPLNLLSRGWGWLTSLPVPVSLRGPLYHGWLHYFAGHPEEMQLPAEAYRSLGDFFVRHLRPGVRAIGPDVTGPLDAAPQLGALSCPADGRVMSAQPVTGNLLEQIKGSHYVLSAFLGEDIIQEHLDTQAAAAAGATATPARRLYQIVIYLGPGDYHRFHSPAAWSVRQRRHFPGELWSVSPAVVRKVRGLFNHNERVVYSGDWAHGRMTFSAIGATNVGSIRINIDPALRTNRANYAPTAQWFRASPPDCLDFTATGARAGGTTHSLVTADASSPSSYLSFPTPVMSADRDLNTGPLAAGGIPPTPEQTPGASPSLNDDPSLVASKTAIGGAQLPADMISMIELDFTPGACCFAFQPGDAVTTLLVSSLDSRDIHVFDARGGSSVPLRTFKIHRSPTHLMKFDPVHNLVVSADRRGHFEIWDPITGDMPEDGPLTFQSKLDTDLFALVTAGTTPTSISISPHGKLFATLSLDRVVRVFELLSGKMIRSYDESLRVIEEMQQAGTAHIQLDSMEFGLRLAKDRELDKPNSALSSVNTVFDDSGNFLLYPTLLGIKVVNIVTNRVVRILGHGENAARFLHISLHQGALKGKSAATLDMLASDNPALKAARETDPTVFATALKMKRFFMLTTREPGDLDGDAAARDVLNERPAGTAATAAASSVNVASLPTTVVLHTSRGDIVLELFPTVAPRTVENFTTHVRRGYYTNILFHRVIRGFMVQTGDPTGTGFGGQSIWGGTFADEFSADPRARHDRPFVLSMANSGPGTNGSQFFITTAPAPHLDNKHTVFGRVASGSEVVTDIEHVRVDREDRPLDEVRILSSSVRD
ncbi:hypothetical protein H696_03692 [Fonticula alba]|uniref:PPIase cyclophilin-type domain-containing protein n=1 Tax=Fonticula alba TaxID=691883 RepID=A0A058Z4R1_FONAL|nr:hypothetical protein H696_03692 [Fonticula alba]KCV69265.1 hypothetical protein H696_03692 [Fonticula alba]|eukprot:XP_009495830.1 hypothetical protein H696_03692 [Fonticula alba]